MRIKLTFLHKILIAIVLGILLGISIKSVVTDIEAMSYIERCIETVGSIVFQMILFSTPLILLGFISSGISELGESGGKMLGINVLYTCISIVISGIISYFFGAIFLSKIVEKSTINIIEEKDIEPIFKLDIIPIMDTITALILAIILGIVSSKLASNRSVLKGILVDTRSVAEFVINKLVIPLLPLYIVTIFFKMSMSDSFINLMFTCLKIIVMIIIVQWVIILLHYTIHAIREKRISNVFKYVKNIFPAYLTAIGTRSSVATLPITMISAKKCNIPQNVIDFSIPINANIHMPGSMVNLVISSMAVMLINGSGSVSFVEYIPFMLVLAIATIATPGVPGGPVIALGFMQSMLGFNHEMIALVLAIDAILDSFITATNVSCDLSIAKFIEGQFQKNVKT